ncbi:MAG: sulfurtransferase TusA family protein [Pseudomonadota bacterium]
MTEATEVDARRLLCPMPVIRLQNQMNQQPAGSQVRIICTDPGTLNDIPAWCRINQHTILECDQQAHEIIFLVKKSDESA